VKRRERRAPSPWRLRLVLWTQPRSFACGSAALRYEPRYPYKL